MKQGLSGKIYPDRVHQSCPRFWGARQGKTPVACGSFYAWHGPGVVTVKRQDANIQSQLPEKGFGSGHHVCEFKYHFTMYQSFADSKYLFREVFDEEKIDDGCDSRVWG